MVELLGVIALIAAIATMGVSAYRGISGAASLTKLESDAKTLNHAVQSYLASGGDLSQASTPEQVLAKLKMVTDESLAFRMPGWSGSMIDPNLRFKYVPVGQSKSTIKRMVWNPDSKQFEIATSGSNGIATVVIEEAEDNQTPGGKTNTISYRPTQNGKTVVASTASLNTNVGPDQETRTASLLYSKDSNWIWDYQEQPLPSASIVDPVVVASVAASPDPSSVLVPVVAPPPPSTLVASPDSIAITEDSGGTWNLLSNDIQSLGQSINLSQFDGRRVGGGPTTLPSGLIVTTTTTGQLSIQPGPGFNYLDDGESVQFSFTYEAVDSDGNVSTGIATLTIQGVDDPIIDSAGAFVYSVSYLDTLSFSGLFGISDVDTSDNPLRVVSAKAVSGTVAIGAGNTINYAPPALGSPLNGGLQNAFQGVGNYTLSVDGVGMGVGMLGTDFIQVEKPVGATVKSAYLLAMGDVWNFQTPSSTPVRIAGVVPVLPYADSDAQKWGYNGATRYGDVTSSLASMLNGLPAGTSDIVVEERERLEGVSLFVVWNDPNAPLTSASIYLGSQNTYNGASGSLLVSSLDTSSADFDVTVGVGIGYSWDDYGGQFSYLKVNGNLIDDKLGGYDDSSTAGSGYGQNGSLWSIGGIGDDPNSGDDELYNLSSYLNDGDTQLNWEIDTSTNHDLDWVTAFYVQARGVSLQTRASDIITIVIENADGDQITITRQVEIY